MLKKRPIIALILIGIAIAIFLGLATQLNTPPPDINTTEGEAEVNFRATAGAVIFSGDCLNVSWSVENIVAVYLNSNATVGQGEEVVCVFPEAKPTLTITTQAGTDIDYVLDIGILTVNPLTNFLILVAALFFLSGVYLLVGQSLRRLNQTRPVRQIRQVIIPMLIITLLTLLALEIVFRTYISTRGTRDEQIMYLWSREEVNSQDQLVKPLPYLNYAANPIHPEHNQMGYRGDEITMPKPDGAFRIVTLGGSTTYSTGTSPEESYPAFLQQILRDDYGYTQVEVINGGMQGYTSWENFVNFAFRVLELDPDMIIIYAAVNDVVAREAASADCYRGNNEMRGLNPGRGVWIEQDQPLSPSALYRFIGIHLGWMSNPLDLDSAFKIVDVQCDGDPAGTTVADRVEANPPVYFENNLRNLLLVAKGNDVIPVLSTWAYYVEADRPDHWEAAIRQHNDITQQLAEELDVPLYDLVSNLPVDGEFWEPDGIHLVAKGTYEQAQQYAQFLDESGQIPKPE